MSGQRHRAGRPGRQHVRAISKVPFNVYEPMEAEYAAEMAENDGEVSVHKYIPQNAIVGWIP